MDKSEEKKIMSALEAIADSMANQMIATTHLLKLMVDLKEKKRMKK